MQHRYVYDATRLAQRETTIPGLDPLDADTLERTRFLETFPGGPIVYADSDGTVDVQMTDSFGKRWFLYCARESRGVRTAGPATKVFRNTGNLHAPALPTWHFRHHPLWYQRVLEPDYVLGRRGTHGWEAGRMGTMRDRGLLIWGLPEEPQDQDRTSWAWGWIIGIGVGLAVLALGIAAVATLGAAAAGAAALLGASAAAGAVFTGVTVGVGLGLGVMGLGTVIGRRIGLGQSFWQVAGGSLADLTGASGVYAGVTGKDIATGEDLGLTYEQRGMMFGQGMLQVAATALGAYKGIRSGIRKFRAWRRARALRKRVNGIAASVSDHVDDTGQFEGTIDDLVAELRQYDDPWLNRIADRYEDLPRTAYLCDDAEFAMYAERHGVGAGANVYYRGGSIYLKRSRGVNIVRDLVHEGTHAVDFGKGGIFQGLDPEALPALKALRRELRAYRAERLLDRSHRPFGNRHNLVETIVRDPRYRARRPL